jgi:aldehyde dehydrogenase (NAD+)
VWAGIIPWNSLLASVALKAAPAVATGNCFILKPSEKTPFAALALGKLVKEASFPPGIFQVLSGDGSTGALLASHIKVKKISFTGSVAIGKKIQMAASQSNMKRVTLELGGKSPAVIFDDCSLDNAATWCANALATNAGQIVLPPRECMCRSVCIPSSTRLTKRHLEATKTGDLSEESTMMGPLVDVAQFDKVSGFIERATKDNAGGILLTGGKRMR